MSFTQFLNNITLLLAMSMVYSLVSRRWRLSTLPGQVMAGFLFGVVAVIGMMNPVQLEAGIVYDGRSILMGIAGLFGGAWAAVIASAVAVFYRLGMGGAGAWTGSGVILTSAALGVAYHYHRRSRPQPLKASHLLGFGLAVHVCMLLWMFTLPGDRSWKVIETIAVPVLTLFPLATLVLGKLLDHREGEIHAEEVMQQNERHFRNLIENAGDAIYMLDTLRNRIADCNQQACLSLGYSRDELLQLSPTDIEAGLNAGEIHAIHAGLKPGMAATVRGTHRRKDGTTFPVEIRLGLFDPSKSQLLIAIVRDVTERRQAEEAIRESEEKYRGLFESITDVAYSIDRDFRIIAVSPSIERYLGYKPEELIGQKVQETSLLEPGQHEKAASDILRVFSGERLFSIEYEFVARDGTRKFGEVNTGPIFRDGRIVSLISVGRDITDRKRSEQALRESEEKFRFITERMSDFIWTADLNFKTRYVSPSITKVLGYTPEERLNQSLSEMMPPESVNKVMETLTLEMERERETGVDPERSVTLELENYCKDGSVIWLEHVVSAIRDGDGNIIGIQGASRDITDRKRSAEELQASEEKFRLLFHNMGEGVALHQMLYDKEGRARDYLVVDVNPAYARHTGIPAEKARGMRASQLYGADVPYLDIYDQVARTGEYHSFETFFVPFQRYFNISVFSPKRGWFGTVFSDITDSRRAEKELHEAEERYRSIFENAREGIFRSTPEGKALLINQAQAEMLGYESVRDFMTHVTDVGRQLYAFPEEREKVREILERQGYIKNYEVQVRRKDGNMIWVSTSMNAVRDDGGTIVCYEGMNEDITDRKLSFERLRRALGATVQAMAATVEERDPYTAGHQRRVADLARAIAKEMGLTPDEVDGIRMAAVIHDIGKISVPAEILSKPTKLKPVEFELIKEHSRSGYEILKDIDFPWPVARMVLEHHERMNGSGYPQGLSGGQILRGACILAVADVVEAVASYRPYRPALGIDAALEEIEKNRETYYDPEVVDACLKLFREGYRMAG